MTSRIKHARAKLVKIFSLNTMMPLARLFALINANAQQELQELNTRQCGLDMDKNF
jgi:hypothetical protein